MSLESLIANQRFLSATGNGDEHYDYLEDYISQVQSESRKLNILFPTIDASKLNELQKKLGSLINIEVFISTQLGILDREMNISTLEQQMQPIRKHVQKLKDIVQTSRTMADLSQQITSHIEQCSTMTKSLNQSLTSTELKSYEGPLEKMMDDCEKINEAIDGLSDKPFVMNLIKPRYEQLVMLVMLLQDKFESYD